MSCGEHWQSATGDIPMHEMTDEHLTNAIQHARAMLDLAHQSDIYSHGRIDESTKRMEQLNREVMRRERVRIAKVGIASYGSAKVRVYKPGDYLLFKKYNPEEWRVGMTATFQPDDLLRVLPRKSGVSAEALIVRRVVDGVEDMVWPEEVTGWLLIGITKRVIEGLEARTQKAEERSFRYEGHGGLVDQIEMATARANAAEAALRLLRQRIGTLLAEGK